MDKEIEILGAVNEPGGPHPAGETRIVGVRVRGNAFQYLYQGLDWMHSLITDAKRWRHIRQRLANGESLAFDPLPSLQNLGGLASTKECALDAAVDSWIMEERQRGEKSA